MHPPGGLTAPLCPAVRDDAQGPHACRLACTFQGLAQEGKQGAPLPSAERVAARQGQGARKRGLGLGGAGGPDRSWEGRPCSGLGLLLVSF